MKVKVKGGKGREGFKGKGGEVKGEGGVEKGGGGLRGEEGERGELKRRGLKVGLKAPPALHSSSLPLSIGGSSQRVWTPP